MLGVGVAEAYRDDAVVEGRAALVRVLTRAMSLVYVSVRTEVDAVEQAVRRRDDARDLVALNPTARLAAGA